MKKIVIMPGGFHPFHAGHMALYNAAREAFPSADVFVAATDDTSGRPFPFKTKKFLAQQAGVPGNRFIRVKSPFRAEEITQMYDEDDTALIFVRSEKDAQKQPQAGGVKKDGSPAYLQPYKRNGLQPFSKHGYMAYLPTVQFGPGMTSATEIRAKWPEMTPEEKISLVKILYPSTAGKDAAAGKIVSMLDEIMGGAVEEGLGKALAAGALAGSMALGTPAVAQSVSDANTRAVVTIDGQQKVFDMGKLDVRKAADMLEKSLESKGVTNYKASVSDGSQRMNIDRTGAVVDRTNEAVLINDPDAGHRIQPEGGMGTWDEASMVSNLARKFASVVDKLKAKDYRSVHAALYQDRWIENLVKALAEYEAFQAKQGRRPVARGREIEMADYLDEKNAS